MRDISPIFARLPLVLLTMSVGSLHLSSIHDTQHANRHSGEISCCTIVVIFWEIRDSYCHGFQDGNIQNFTYFFQDDQGDLTGFEGQVWCFHHLPKWRTLHKNFGGCGTFPICVGIIDGKHTKIRAPPRLGSVFTSSFHHVFVGDTAFLLHFNLMRPYAGKMYRMQSETVQNNVEQVQFT